MTSSHRTSTDAAGLAVGDSLSESPTFRVISNGGAVQALGEIDLNTADLLRSHLQSVIATGVDIELDMSGVEFIDSMGLAVLVEMLGTMGDDGRFVVVSPSRVVTRLLDVTGLTAAMGLPANSE